MVLPAAVVLVLALPLSELKAPGAIPFTLIWYRAHSTASTSVMRDIPAFVIE